MALIDKETIRKEIEFAKSVYSNPKRVVHGVADAFRQDGRAAMCDDILKSLDTLPEQPVGGLEEEIENYYGYIPDDRDKIESARHFAEWGAEHLKR